MSRVAGVFRSELDRSGIPKIELEYRIVRSTVLQGQWFISSVISLELILLMSR